MMSYRQRGFVGVYNILCYIAALFLLQAYAWVLPWIPGVYLEEDVSLVPYLIAVLVGMIWAQRGTETASLDLHRLSGAEAARLAFRQVGVVAICIFTLMFAIKDRGVSRLFLGSYLVLLWGGITWLHWRMPGLLASWLFSKRDVTPTLFIGRRDNAGVLDRWVERRLHLGVLPVGLLSDEGPAAGPSSRIPYLGATTKLAAMIREHQVAQVILLGWVDDATAVEKMIQTCEAEGCRFLIHNDYGARFARRFIPHEEGGHHFLAVQFEPLEDPINRAAKRLLDIVIALPVVVFILAPLCGIIWLVQRRQAPGSLFFIMPRAGWRRERFLMLKFRSMYAEGRDINRQATQGDPRVYPLGRLLRRTSLDELPQFWNVLRGEMSVVGPRPHLPQHDDEFSLIAPSYRTRALVKPGITGLAQTKGFRGEISDPEKLHKRVYWDLYYARSWSFALDVRICLQTAWQMIFPPDSAY